MDKKSNYLKALAVFLLTLGMMLGLSVTFSFFISFAGMLLGDTMAERTYSFLMNQQNLFSACIYCVVLSVFALWYYFSVVSQEGLKAYMRRSTSGLSVAGCLKIVVSAFAIMKMSSFVFTAVEWISPKLMDEYSELVESAGMSDYSLIWAVSILILPPLTEEIIFRGLILNYLERAGAAFFLANLIQAVCFGIFHMNIVQGLYTAMVGFLLGYLAHHYDTLLAPMLCHLCFNLFGTLYTDLEGLFLSDTARVVLVIQSVPLLILVLILIHFRVGEKKKVRR